MYRLLPPPRLSPSTLRAPSRTRQRTFEIEFFTVSCLVFMMFEIAV